ncbi:uncharacterized protein LOC120333237 [Styela clava]
MINLEMISSEPSVIFREEKEFHDNPPAGFTKGEDGNLRFDPDDVNVFENFAIATSNSTKIFKVKNLNEFVSLKTKLQLKPIYVRMHIATRIFGCCKDTEHRSFIVEIRAGNLWIASQLQQSFADAEELIKEEQKDMMCSSNTDNCFYLTNFRPRFERLYTVNMIALIAQVPIALIFAVPYYIYRAVAATDSQIELMCNCAWANNEANAI